MFLICYFQVHINLNCFDLNTFQSQRSIVNTFLVFIFTFPGGYPVIDMS